MVYEREETYLKFKKHHAARFIILNNPKNFNVVFIEMLNDLYPYMKILEKSNDPKKFGIITSAPGKVFSAGANVRRTLAAIENGGDDMAVLDVGYEIAYQLLYYIGNMETPVVSIMNGISMGAGAMIPCLTPFRIATENTVVAMGETKIGSFADSASSYVLTRLEKNVGVYLALTSSKIKAEDVVLCGLATHFVKSENLDAMNEKLSKLEEPTHANINKIIEEFAVSNDHAPVHYTLHGEVLDTIERCFKYDTVEEIIHALEKDGSRFALKSKMEILDASPTSVKITLEAYRRGEKQSMKECLQLENHVSQLIFHGPEFKEGVISTLVKRKRPEWNPNNLEQVDLKEIREKYFTNISELNVDKVKTEYFTHPNCSRFALPLQKEIEQVFEKFNKSKAKTINHFLAEYNNKFGVKQKVEESVRSYIKYVLKRSKEILKASNLKLKSTNAVAKL